MWISRYFRSPRIWANAVIVGYLSLAIVDAIPLPGGADHPAKRVTDPLLDGLGIWQGTWDLFAPSVDKTNHRIIAEIHVSGEEMPLKWYSPDWTQMSCLELFRLSREVEYYDRIRSGWNQPAQESFAAYLKRNHEAAHPGSVVTGIHLIAHERRILIQSEDPQETIEEFYRREFQDE
ncbi:MAG: hypothetical protein P1U85_15570 [Verrucomicrobiales bacterium]|nr:hypothetical protein [Verrucomicrobiales bacterium]